MTNAKYSLSIESVDVSTAASGSDAINYCDFDKGMIFVPSGSGLTTLAWHVSISENGTYFPARNAAGVITQTVAAGNAYPIPVDLQSARFLKVTGNAAGVLIVTLAFGGGGGSGAGGGVGGGGSSDTTEATQLAVLAEVTSIDAKTPALVGGRLPVDLPTGLSTAALQTTGNTSLAAIDAKIPAVDNAKQPVIASFTSGGNLSAQTNATGTNFTAFGAQACKQLTVSNQTGTTIEVQQGGSGVAFQVPTGAFYTFFGITNANQLGIRRTDTSNTQVTVTARWES